MQATSRTLSYTPFSITNYEFSNLAHEDAKTSIYPHLFNCTPDALTFEDMSEGDKWRKWDVERSIDRVVSVNTTRTRAPLVIEVQERFRRVDYAHMRDLTLSEWNNNTNIPSEMFKIRAGIFLCGYYDPQNGFGEVVAVATQALLIAIASGMMEIEDKHRRLNKRSNQDFLAFKFDTLIKAGCVVWHKPP